MPCLVMAVSVGHSTALGPPSPGRRRPKYAPPDMRKHGTYVVAVSRLPFIIPARRFTARFLINLRWSPSLGSMAEQSAYNPLHKYALRAAASLLLAVVNVHRLGWTVDARDSSAPGRISLHLAVVPSDFTHEVVKRLIDIDPRLRRRFDEFAVERPS